MVPVEQRWSAPRLGGLLLGYALLLVLLLIHGIGLTIATLIIDANPSLVGLTDLGPASHVVFYVVTNCLLAAYGAVLLWLILTKRRAAVVHNYVYCVASIGCLVAWNALGMKSPLGTVIDSLPGVVGILYFATSARVKRTLVRPLGKSSRRPMVLASQPVVEADRAAETRLGPAQRARGQTPSVRARESHLQNGAADPVVGE